MHYKIELFSLDSFLETKLDFSSSPKNAPCRHFSGKFALILLQMHKTYLADKDLGILQ